MTTRNSGQKRPLGNPGGPVNQRKEQWGGERNQHENYPEMDKNGITSTHL
jgi:hypothetical protein